MKALKTLDLYDICAISPTAHTALPGTHNKIVRSKLSENQKSFICAIFQITYATVFAVTPALRHPYYTHLKSVPVMLQITYLYIQHQHKFYPAHFQAAAFQTL